MLLYLFLAGSTSEAYFFPEQEPSTICEKKAVLALFLLDSKIIICEKFV